MPFAGLVPLDERSARFLFGRDAEVAEAVELVADAASVGPISPGLAVPTPLVVVVGASGSGKSSLVRAGLVPALSDVRHAVVVRPGADPDASFMDARRRLGDHTGPALLVVDQLEELWTRSAGLSGTDALRSLLYPALPDTVIVSTLRADFYAAASRDTVLAAALRKRQLLIEPLAENALARVVTGPAEIAGLEIEPGLTDRIVGDALVHSRSGAVVASLPHLSHCLRRMWETRDRNVFTHDLYEQTGGIGGALASTAEILYRSLPPEDCATARRLLLRLIVVEEGMAPTAGELPVSTVRAAGEQRIVDRLASERLVVVDDKEVRLAHEALVVAWPRLVGWIDEDRAALKTANLVEREAGEWRARSEDPDLLLRGTRLDAAAALVDSSTLLSEPARSFVAAGRQAAEQARARAIRTDRRLRRLLIAASAAAVVALVGCLGLVYTADRLASARDGAQAGGMAAASLDLADRDPAMADQLALAAFDAADSVETRSAILEAGAHPRTVNLEGPTGVRFIGAAVDASLMVVGGSGRELDLFDTRPVVPRLVATLPAPLGGNPKGEVYATCLSADGRWLAAGGTAGILRVWDLSDPARPVMVADGIELGGTIYDLAMDPKRGVLYTAAAVSGDGAPAAVRTWRLGARLTEEAPLDAAGPVSALSVLDGGRVAVGDAAGLVSVWDPQHPEAALAQRVVGGRQVTGIAQQGGDLIVSSRAAKGFRLAWDQSADTLGEPEEVGSFTNWVNDVATSPQARLAALGSSDKSVVVLDGEGVVRERIPVGDNVTSLAFIAPRRLAIGSVDGRTIVRDLPPYAGNGTFGSVYGTGWARDRPLVALGAVAATGMHDVSLWDVHDPARPVEVGRLRKGSAEGRSNGAVDVTPDGRLVVDSTDAGWIDGWDVSHPDRPVEQFAVP